MSARTQKTSGEPPAFACGGIDSFNARDGKRSRPHRRRTRRRPEQPARAARECLQRQVSSVFLVAAGPQTLT